MSRDVRVKYRDFINAVDALRPGCWPEMADEILNLFVRSITTCGGGESELPTQEETETAVDAARKAAVQAEVKNQESPRGSPPERRSPPAPRDWSVPPSGAPSPEDPEPLQGC